MRIAKLIDVKLQVNFIKQGKSYIAYSPAFDLSTSGKTIKQAQKRFEEAVEIFIDELIKSKHLENVLTELGWQQSKTKWNPPQIVENISINCKVPVAA